MIGTLLNIFTIVLGTVIGILVGNRLTDKMQDSVMTGLGLTTLVVGMESALKTGNILIPLLSLVSGTIIGELLNLDGIIKRFGGWLQTKVASMGGPQQHNDAAQARLRFINGFVTASLLFCIGPMAVLGSVQNGINPNDYQTLAIKSTLDFFASIAFASTLGMGVGFAALPTALIQGAFVIVGMALGTSLMADGGLNSNLPVLREMTATGGLLLLGISLTLLNIKQPRLSNFLPALLIAPLMVLVLLALGIKIYP